MSNIGAFGLLFMATIYFDFVIPVVNWTAPCTPSVINSLGTTPETLSRQFTILKKDGVITQSSNNYIKINGLSHKDITCEIC